MNKELKNELLKKLPIDVVINVILPYTYLPQPYELLLDLRTFYSDFSIVENAYIYNYNYYILLYDLTCFCNLSKFLDYNMSNYFGKVLNRMFMMKSWNYSRLNNYVFVIFHRDVMRYTLRKIRFLLGALNPIERTRFINKYILDD